MANVKLSAKTELASVANTDVLPIIDVSDTTDGAGGTSKKITRANLLAGQSLTNISDVTATAAEVNILDGVTSTTAELNILDGVVATTAQLNALNDIVGGNAVISNLDGTLTASSVSALELASLLDIDSNVQTQLDSKSPKASPTFTGTVTLPTGLTGILRADSGVVSVDPNTRYIDWRVLAADTDQGVDTTVGGDFEFPFTGTITAIGAYCDTAGVTGTATIDVNKNDTTLMSATKISIETGEKSSRNATTQPVLSTTSITAGDILTADIDAVQSGTVAKGLVIRLEVRKT